MPSFQLPPLTEILKPGRSGGNQFADLVALLFEAEEGTNPDFHVLNIDDSKGDFRGADAVINRRRQEIYVQVKFFKSPLSSDHKYVIKKSFAEFDALDNTKLHWWLITPNDLSASDMDWFQDLTKGRGIHRGHKFINHMALKHPHVGRTVYPHHKFAEVAEAWRTPRDPQGFFKQLISDYSNVESIIRNAQPSHYDCHQIFPPEWADYMAILYREYFRALDFSEENAKRFSECKHVKFSKIAWKDYVKSGESSFPGGMKNLIGIVNEDSLFYSIKLLKETNEEFGISQICWAFINRRWVYFGKMNKLWRIANGVIHNEDVKIFIKLANKLGLKKQLQQFPPEEVRSALAIILEKILQSHKE